MENINYIRSVKPVKNAPNVRNGSGAVIIEAVYGGLGLDIYQMYANALVAKVPTRELRSKLIDNMNDALLHASSRLVSWIDETHAKTLKTLAA